MTSGETLVEGLKNLGFSTASVHLQKSGERGGQRYEQHVVKLKGKDFETFIEVAGPYLHPSMHSKLPPPRVTGSRHGKGDASFCDFHLGRAFKEKSFDLGSPS